MDMKKEDFMNAIRVFFKNEVGIYGSWSNKLEFASKRDDLCQAIASQIVDVLVLEEKIIGKGAIEKERVEIGHVFGPWGFKIARSSRKK